MTQTIMSPFTRRSAVAGVALATVPLVLKGTSQSSAQEQKPAPQQGAKSDTGDKPLYERLGGIFAIAQVVDHFSDALIKNPVVGKNSKNPQLREWHTKDLERLPGLKWMRTLWVAEVSGGPYKYVGTKPGATPLGLEEAHRNLKITPAEFDEVAAELGRTLDFAKVPMREKNEVLKAFAAHKDEVTAGAKRG
jgi:hemoglobin